MTNKREDQVAEAAKKYADENYPELALAPENEQLADVAEAAFLAGAVFEQSHTPTNDERTDDLLRIAQEAFTDAPFSDERDGTLAPLRHVVDAILAALRSPVQGEPTDATLGVMAEL